MTLKTILFGAASALVLSAGSATAAPATAATSLNVRSGPGTQFEVIGTIPAGATVDVGGCTGSWCEVNFRGGTGFASGSYLAMAGGGAAVAVAPGYVYGEPYYDDYYDYGYGYGPSFGFSVSPGRRFHHGGWDRGHAWNGGGNWNRGHWTGGRPGMAQGGRGLQGGQLGRNLQGGSIGGRASVNAPTGMPSGGSFRGGGGGAPMGGAAPAGGGHAGGGAIGGARGGGVGRH